MGLNTEVPPHVDPAYFFETQAPTMFGVGVLMIIISIASVALRFWSRRISGIGFWLDDWFALAAVVSIFNHVKNGFANSTISHGTSPSSLSIFTERKSDGVDTPLSPLLPTQNLSVTGSVTYLLWYYSTMLESPCSSALSSPCTSGYSAFESIFGKLASRWASSFSHGWSLPSFSRSSAVGRSAGNGTLLALRAS